MKNVTSRLLAMGLSGSLAISGGTIAIHEGYVPGTYLDPAGIVTACFGHVSPALRLGQQISDDECLRKLADDLVKHNNQLLAAVRVSLSEQEHAAYLSFIYNLGVGNFRSSTMLRHLNAGNRVNACNELPRWVYVTVLGIKIKLPGLVTRRAHERELCLKGALLHAE